MSETLNTLRRELAVFAKRLAALEEKQGMPSKPDFSGIEGHIEHESAPQSKPKLDFSHIQGHIEHSR